MFRSAVVALAVALSLASPCRAIERIHPHPYRHFRYRPLLPPINPIVPQPAPPPLHIRHHQYEGEPLPYPEQLAPESAPSLPGGMEITVTKNLTETAETENKQGQKPITLPKQAAERLATCWSPPLPAKGDANEVTLRFAFNRSGSVIGGSPRITYVKAGQGVKPDDVRKSILDAFKSCTPLDFSASMASSMPGYPLSVRFIGRRSQD